jgi:hypothetical protein
MTTQVISPKWKIFDPVVEDTSTKSFEYKRIYSPDTGNLNNVSVIKFEVRDHDAYLLPNKGYLLVKANIVDTNSSAAFDATYNVASKILEVYLNRHVCSWPIKKLKELTRVTG